jgi:hypothetical protein
MSETNMYCAENKGFARKGSPDGESILPPLDS